MNNSTLVAICLSFFVVACGYGREEDKEAHRKEELQEISKEMNNSLTTLSSLKAQLRDSISRYSVTEDSLAQVKKDKYQLLMVELEQAEDAYRNWQQEVEYEPSNMNHEEAMMYYEKEEDKARTIQQDIEKTVRYVRNEVES